MLGAIIFDFDGVITDSEVLHFRSFNQVLDQHDIKITKRDYYREYLGLSDFDLFGLMAKRGQLKLDSNGIDELIKRKNRIFEELASTEGEIIEGVRDFLEMLKQNNIPIAIYSGALLVEIELILEQARLRDFFEAIVSAEQVKKGKPAPEGFLLALERLNHRDRNSISAGRCIVIEDSHWGLEAAKAAEMHTIAVTNSYEADQLTMAEKVVAHLGELDISSLEELCR